MQHAGDPLQPSQSLQHLERRLARLERQNRTLRRVFIAIATLAALVVAPTLTGADDKASGAATLERVSTKRLEVVDAAGQPRIVLDTTGNRPALQILDSAGTPRVIVALTKKDAPMVSLRSPEKRSQLTLIAPKGQGGHVVLFDKEGNAVKE